MLREKLAYYQSTGQTIGFCKWPDGQGLLFGKVRSVSPTEATFLEIGLLGNEEGEMTVALESISNVEEAPAYVERLRLFRLYANGVRVSAKGQTCRTPEVIAQLLSEACASGECVQIHLINREKFSCRVTAFDGAFCQIEEFLDDPFAPIDFRLTRLDQVSKLRLRSGSELAMTEVWRSSV